MRIRDSPSLRNRQHHPPNSRLKINPTIFYINPALKAPNFGFIPTKIDNPDRIPDSDHNSLVEIFLKLNLDSLNKYWPESQISFYSLKKVCRWLFLTKWYRKSFWPAITSFWYTNEEVTFIPVNRIKARKKRQNKRWKLHVFFDPIKASQLRQ